RGRDRQVRSTLTLHDERRRRRIPGRVPPGLERRAQSTRRERRRIRLALNELLARELDDRPTPLVGSHERVVLLRGLAGQWLEPVGEVRRTLLECPFLH